MGRASVWAGHVAELPVVRRTPERAAAANAMGELRFAVYPRAAALVLAVAHGPADKPAGGA